MINLSLRVFEKQSPVSRGRFAASHTCPGGRCRGLALATTSGRRSMRCRSPFVDATHRPDHLLPTLSLFAPDLPAFFPFWRKGAAQIR